MLYATGTLEITGDIQQGLGVRDMWPDKTSQSMDMVDLFMSVPDSREDQMNDVAMPIGTSQL